jgi:hypothetical protein
MSKGAMAKPQKLLLYQAARSCICLPIQELETSKLLSGSVLEFSNVALDPISSDTGLFDSDIAKMNNVPDVDNVAIGGACHTVPQCE